MEVSDQLHAPAALSLPKELLIYPFDRRVMQLLKLVIMRAM
jgi:hypothetical protein